VSALGADDEAASAFHRSKRAADEFLLSLPLRGVVVQPSLVFGLGGASAELFTRLAALPLVPLPAGGVQQVQPVHVDDVVKALVVLVEGATTGRIALVGPRPLLLREYLATLRTSLGLGQARFVSVPGAVMLGAARLADRIEQAPFDSDAWQMLQRGNTGEPDAIASLLGRAPRDATDFIAPAEAPLLRRSAQLAWLAPLLRLSLAAVWIVTGVVSLGIYPVAESDALLARAGVAEALRPAALYGAALLDLALGIATLAVRRRSWLWLAQIALILAYTAIISVRLPEFWLHPYGPVLKNLPILAVLLLLYVIERPHPGERRGI
jgi:DoxX-like family